MTEKVLFETEQVYVDIKSIECNMKEETCILRDINGNAEKVKNIANLSNVYPLKDLMMGNNRLNIEYSKGSFCSLESIKIKDKIIKQLNCIGYI